MPRRWFRNWPVKLAAAGIAVAATFGFYGLIEANPLDGSTSNNTSASGNTTSSVAALPTTAKGSAQSVQPKATPQPQSQRPQRVRSSRGS